MITILGDTAKFIRLGPVDTHYLTVSIEIKFQKNLVIWVKSKLLLSAISNKIWHIGFFHLRLYGLPKSHMDGVPLRPILPMIVFCSTQTYYVAYDNSTTCVELLNYLLYEGLLSFLLFHKSLSLD